VASTLQQRSRGQRIAFTRDREPSDFPVKKRFGTLPTRGPLRPLKFVNPYTPPSDVADEAEAVTAPPLGRRPPVRPLRTFAVAAFGTLLFAGPFIGIAPTRTMICAVTGEKSIDRNVLAQFRKLTGDDVAWVTLHGGGFWAGAHWRKREAGDSGGGSQYQDG
jgi:hypothetical protein